MDCDYKLVRLAALTFLGLIALLTLGIAYAAHLQQQCVEANTTRPGLEVLAICRGVR